MGGEAVLTVAYLINRMPTVVHLYQTPIQCFLRTYPHDRTHMDLPKKVFGCVAFVYLHGHERGKLDPKARKYVFVGYSPTQKRYKCFDPHSKKSFVDVTFFENQPYFSLTSLQGRIVLKISSGKFLGLPFLFLLRVQFYLVYSLLLVLALITL